MRTDLDSLYLVVEHGETPELVGEVQELSNCLLNIGLCTVGNRTKVLFRVLRGRSETGELHVHVDDGNVLTAVVKQAVEVGHVTFDQALVIVGYAHACKVHRCVGKLCFYGDQLGSEQAVEGCDGHHAVDVLLQIIPKTVLYVHLLCEGVHRGAVILAVDVDLPGQQALTNNPLLGINKTQVEVPFEDNVLSSVDAGCLVNVEKQ